MGLVKSIQMVFVDSSISSQIINSRPCLWRLSVFNNAKRVSYIYNGKDEKKFNTVVGDCCCSVFRYK